MSFRFALRLAAVGFCLLSPIPLLGQTAEYVIQISVDGLHAGRLHSLLQDSPETYPNLQRFVVEGATTLDARNDFFSPWTLPNHVTMMTGRPVLAPTDDPTRHHGYTRNTTPPSTDMLHTFNPAVPYIASVFDVAHDHGRSTALYATKQKFVLLEQTYNQTEQTLGGREDQFLADGDHGVDKIDQFVYDATDFTSANLVTRFVQDMTDSPYQLSFLHFLEPDLVGHSSGWQTEQWDAAIEEVDQHLGGIFELVETDEQLRDRTTILLTSDHGGLSLTHDQRIGENVYRIPLFAWGTGVAQGVDLYDLNHYTRNHPGNRRVDYLESPPPIRNGDLANLALARLGLPPVEDSMLNHDQDLLLDFPREATWVGDDPQSGEPGDARRWTDERNWVRADQVDERIVAGDALILSANSELQTIALASETQGVKSVSIHGDYQFTGGNLIVHTGRVHVAADVELIVERDLTSPEGLIVDGGGELVVGGTVNDLLLVDGTLSQVARVNGSLTVGGNLSPGRQDIGTLQITDDLILRGQAVLSLGIADGARSDHLQVTDRARLSGHLSIDVDRGYQDPMQLGTFDRFELLSTRFLIGAFLSVDYEDQDVDFDVRDGTMRAVHVDEGLFRIIAYDQGVSWINYRAMPGDVDGDGRFATSDLVILFESGGFEDETEDNAIWVTGDWNGDLDFDSSDLVEAFRFGAYEQPSIFQAAGPPPVPEPSSACLILLGIVFAIRVWRRGKS